MSELITQELNTPYQLIKCNEPDVLIIEATDPNGPTINNAAKAVVKDVVQKYGQQFNHKNGLIYLDSDGYFDILSIENGEFKKYLPLRATTVEQALDLRKAKYVAS